MSRLSGNTNSSWADSKHSVTLEDMYEEKLGVEWKLKREQMENKVEYFRMSSQVDGGGVSESDAEVDKA